MSYQQTPERWLRVRNKLVIAKNGLIVKVKYGGRKEDEESAGVQSGAFGGAKVGKSDCGMPAASGRGWVRGFVVTEDAADGHEKFLVVDGLLEEGDGAGGHGAGLEFHGVA